MPADAALTDADAAALRRAAAGDHAAFEQLVARHEAAVLRLARAIARDEAAAEDALQEAFLAAWRAAAGFRGESSVRSWLLTITRHAVLRQRRGQREHPADHDTLEQLGVAAGWGDDRHGDWGRRVEQRDLVAAGFARLAPDDREILVLRDLEGFSGEEVAAMLGIALPAMKSRLHRARLRFAANLRGTHDHGA